MELDKKKEARKKAYLKYIKTEKGKEALKRARKKMYQNHIDDFKKRNKERYEKTKESIIRLKKLENFILTNGVNPNNI